MNTLEIWQPIYGYEDYYEISNKGTVRSMTRVVKLKKGARKLSPKLIKSRINNCGYEEVRLSKYGIVYTRFIHVLVAETFIPKPKNKKEVNHLNGDKLDNTIGNLEWCTHSENMKHAYKTGLCNTENRQTPVIDICINKEFESIKKAAAYHNIPYSTCKGYLNGYRRNITCLRYLDTVASKVA